MALVDQIAIGVASAALAVSIISLYFSVFHKRLSLVGALASWNSTSSESELHQTCEVTLSNTGNRELLVREVMLLLEPELEGDLFPVLDTPQIPVVIKPGQIILLQLDIPTLFMNKAANRQQKIKLEFHIYTPKAKLRLARKVLSPISENTEPTKTDWLPFTMDKSCSKR